MNSIGLLSEKKRSFIKVLRYNLAKNDPMPSAILTDTYRSVWTYVVLGELDKAGPSREAHAGDDSPTLAILHGCGSCERHPPDLPA